MKVVRLASPGGLDKLSLQDEKDPGSPGPGEVRVRLHASSLNYHDLGVVSGRMPAADGRIPMSDGAGVVEAVGDGVARFSVGDPVVSCFFPYWEDGEPPIADFSQTPGDGIDGYARECVVAPGSFLTPAPRGYSPIEAATLTTAGLTAYRALVVNGKLKPGETALALGTGGVSIFALQIAKAMGGKVIVTSSSDEKLERAKLLGADYAINYRRTERWADAVLEFTDGRGVDHVVEVGGAGTLPQSIAACRIGGHIALIGVLAGRSGEIPTGLLMRRQQRLHGLIVGSRKHQEDFIAALNALSIRPVIDRSFALEETAGAFHYEMAGRHFGKIGLLY